jgi:hypothetical protein
MLGLPHISAKSYYSLTYHYAKYYNTVLTIYQLQVFINPNYLIIPLLLHMYVQTIFSSTHIHNSTTYIYIQHHVIRSLIIPTYNFNCLNIILNSTLHNSIINTYLRQTSTTIYNQDLSTSIYPYNLQSNISQTHSHLFSCIFLHYLIITFPFTIQISCILQYQFINVYHIHNINLVRYSTSIQRHAIIRNTNLMYPSTSIHQHIFTI